MAENKKMSLTALIIVVLILGSLAITFFIMKENERQQRIMVEQTLEETLQAKEQTLKELNEMTRLKDEVELKAEELKKEAEKLSQDLESEKKEKQLVLTKVEEREKKIKELSVALEENKTELEELMESIASFKNQNEELTSQLSQIKLAKRTLEDRILSGGSGAGTVELEKIVVKKNDENIKGKVLVVNKEFNFVILDLGRGSNVEAGTILDVKRGTELLGKVEVENVYDDMSSAVILSQWQKGPIQENDIVELP